MTLRALFVKESISGLQRITARLYLVERGLIALEAH